MTSWGHAQLRFYTASEARRIMPDGHMTEWSRLEPPRPRPFDKAAPRVEHRLVRCAEWYGPDRRAEEVQQDGWIDVDYLNRYSRDGWELVTFLVDRSAGQSYNNGQSSVTPDQTRAIMRRRIADS